VSIVFISLALLGISGLLMDSHRRAWREAREATGLSERERRFAGAVYRRRMLASGTVGAVGAAIAVGPLVPRRPLPISVYLAMLLAACAVIMLLAMLDVWATRRHYRQMRNEHRHKQLELAVELAAARESAEGER
jgi:hypothetical protein